MPKQLHAYGIILRPLITEKAQIMTATADKYAFEVDKRANKMQIKEAVEVAFNVNVKEVNTALMKGKRRRYGRGDDEAAGLEEGRGDAGTGREDRTVRGRVAMAVKQFKPTSPGRRGSSGFTFDEITKKKPEKSLLATRKRMAGRNNQGKITVRHRGGGIEAPHPHRRLQARQAGRAGPRRGDRVRPRPQLSHRADLRIATARSGTSLRRVGLKVGEMIQAGARSRSEGGQHAAAAEHAERHGDPQHRADAWPRRPDRPQRRHVGAADGEGRRVHAAATALGRDAARPLADARRPSGRSGTPRTA